MTNYREILRLDSLGLNKTQIAEACGCSRTTVIQTLRLAKEKGLEHPLPESMWDKQLAHINIRRISNSHIHSLLITTFQ